MPSITARSLTTSRVVPAIGVTIARSDRSSALSRLLLPTFGRPTSATVAPSLSNRPLFAPASTPSSASTACDRSAWTSLTGISSSGKSAEASR